MLERRANREHLGVGLGVHETREAVAGPQRTQAPWAMSGSFSIAHAGRVEGLMAVGFEIVGELLDARLVGHGREGIGRAGGGLGGSSPRAPCTW